MTEQKSRLFLGNLPTATTENDIKHKLQKYGQVTSIEIKQKKEIDNVTIASTFAYIDLNADKSTLQQCLQDLRSKDWNGSYIKAEIAKESFLQRLQRERNENSNTTFSHNTKTNISNDENIRRQKVNALHLPHEDSKFKKRKTSFEDDHVKDANTSGEDNLLSKLESFSDLWKDDVPIARTRPLKQAKIDRSRNFTTKGIPAEKHQPSLNSSTSDFLDKSNPAAKESELKRLKALEEKNKAMMQQKEAIKNALSSIDQAKSSKKIVFDDDGDPVLNFPSSSLQSKKNFTDHITETGVAKGQRNNGFKKSSEQLQLFDGQEDEADTWQGDFRFKKQFEGKKGQKLLEMQARFKDDDRFVFDERFYESDGEDETTDKVAEPPATAEEKDLLEEKARELEILASVLGEPVQPTAPKKNTSFNAMVRFDPLKPSHAKFELSKPIDSKQKTPDLNRRDKIRTVEGEQSFEKGNRIENEPLPVDEKQFYHVTSNLKDLFKKDDTKLQASSSTTFSLRQMFSSAGDNETGEKENDNEPDQNSSKNDQQKSRATNKTFLRGFQDSKPLAMFSKKLLRPEPESGCNTFCKGVNVEAIKEKFTEKRRVLGRMLHKKKIILERQQHFKHKIGVASATHNKSMGRNSMFRRKQSKLGGTNRGRR